MREKVKYDITIKSVENTTNNGVPVYIAWKRGSKPENNGETKRVVVEDNKASFEETISLDCTIFKTAKKGYLPKNLTFNLYQELIKKDSLGKITIDLTEYIGVPLGQTRTLEFKPAHRTDTPPSLVLTFTVTEEAETTDNNNNAVGGSPTRHVHDHDDGPVFLDPSEFLTEEEIQKIREALPERHYWDTWNLAYSTAKHGISMNTFHTKVKEKAPMILLVEDDKKYVFGGYVADNWQMNKKGHYGSGESFLFKVRPEFKIFKWANKNNYFMLNDKDFIALGGGGAGFGLWLDSEFDHGSSVSCDTFLNEPLASEVDFKAVMFEAWVVTPKPAVKK